MLVLHRKKHESFTITTPAGDVITITQCGNQKIGVDAPADHKVLRTELEEY